MIYIGTAGWAIRQELKDQFPASGTHLQRYAQRLNAVEINSSFYRDHKFKTYAAWAASVPAHFSFSLKLSNEFTHKQHLVSNDGELERWFEGVHGLGNKLGGLLIQLPPSLKFNPAVAENFFSEIRKRFAGAVALEPRHRSWTSAAAKACTAEFDIARVWADPARIANESDEALVTRSTVYLRLHGSPQIYRSSYEPAQLSLIAQRLVTMQESAKSVWCIFDNTTFGHATRNAFSIRAILQRNLGVLKPHAIHP